MNLGDRARGSVLGLLAADALGVPVDGMGRDEFAPVTGPSGGGSHGQPPGTFSDDGSKTLCTVESLVEKGGLDPADLGDRLLRWLFNRHWAARRVTFGFGFTTREAIVRIREGKPAAEAGLATEDSNGNGSLTRILPVALLAHARKLSPRETVDLAHAASKVTHAHPRAQLVCGLASLFARGLLDGKSLEDAIAFFREKAGELYASDPWNDEYGHLRGIMERTWSYVDRHDVKSSGYVVDTFESVLWCLKKHEGAYEPSVLEAINLGDDGHAIGSIVGGFAGLIHGQGAIPQAWLAELARRDEVDALLARFEKLIEA